MATPARDVEQTYTNDRLKNQNAAGEGKTLPPRMQNGVRVPVVSNLRQLQAISFTGGTQFTIAWDTPPLDSNTSLANYVVSVKGINSGTANVAMAPVSVQTSPAVIRVVSNEVTRAIITVQTVLTNGQTSFIDISPTIAVQTIAPSITPSDIPASTLEGLNLVLGYSNLSTNGGIAYVENTGTITEDPTNFFYDSTNKREGLLTNTPKSTLDNRGSLGLSFSSKNTNFTAANIFWYDVDTSSGNVTVTLPSASGVGSRFYLFRKSTSDINTVIVGSSFTLNYINETILIASNGSSYVNLVHSIL